jgi:hypothetical protein
MKIKSLQIQVQLDTYGDTPEADCVLIFFNNWYATYQRLLMPVMLKVQLDGKCDLIFDICSVKIWCATYRFETTSSGASLENPLMRSFMCHIFCDEWTRMWKKNALSFPLLHHLNFSNSCAELMEPRGKCQSIDLIRIDQFKPSD